MAWAPDYASDDELSDYVRIDDDLDDAQLALAITTASRSIDRHCRRQFGKVDVAAARYYTARWSCRHGAWVVGIDDLMVAPTEVAVDDGTGTYPSVVTGYVVQPRNAAAEGRPWTRLVFSASQGCGLEDGVRVTALWGWTAVPDTIKQACLLQASRLLARRDAPFGVAGSPDAGSEVRLLAKVDPDVAVSLSPFRRLAAVA